VTLLRDIRINGVFREPQFTDLGLEHVPFDELTKTDAVERALLDGIRAGGSAAVTGARGSGKSSVLAWVCRNLPDDHIPIRVPVVGMDDPSDPSVLGSVALGAALEAARVQDDVELGADQRARVENARADELTRRPGASRLGGKLGGGPVPAEVSAELGSLGAEYARGVQPVDRLYGFDRLLGVFSDHGLIPVFVLEDTEAALGAGTDEATRDRFFASSLRLLIREVDTPTVIAVQSAFTQLDAYDELRPHVLEIAVPVLEQGVEASLTSILARRLEFFGIDASVEETVAPEAIPALAAFYAEKGGSIRHVLAALDAATATAVENGDVRLEPGHVRLGIEDWRDR
jgi:hypothetical protein